MVTQREVKDNVATPSHTGVALAAFAATLITKSILHPLDTIKCRLQNVHSVAPVATQTTGGIPSAAVSSACAAQPRSTFPRPRPNRSFAPASCHRWRQVQEAYAGKWGFRHLYGGLVVKLICYAPLQTVYMTTYSSARSSLGVSEVDRATDGAWPIMWRSILVAVAAELSVCGGRVPMEVIKMRVQAAVSRNSVNAAKQVYHNGWRACARLVLPHTLLHDIPYSAVQWTLYEFVTPWTKRMWDGYQQGKEKRSSIHSRMEPRAMTRFRDKFICTFFSGGFSSLLASIITVPLDTVRSKTTVASLTNPTLTVRQVVLRTYNQGGLRAFYQGGAMRILWVTSNVALYLPLFELLKLVALQYEPNTEPSREISTHSS